MSYVWPLPKSLATKTLLQEKRIPRWRETISITQEYESNRETTFASDQG